MIEHIEGYHSNIQKNKWQNINTANNLLKGINFDSNKYFKQLGTTLFLDSDKEDLNNAHTYTDYEQDCPEGSCLFTIINIGGKKVPIKICEGSFNLETFNQANINKDQEHVENYQNIKGLGHTPIPLFVTHPIDIENINFHEIIKNTIIIVPKKKEAFLSYNPDKEFKRIHIPSTKEAQTKINNAILKTKITNKDRHYLKKIIKDLKELSIEKFAKKVNNKQTRNEQNPRSDVFKKLIELLKKMVPQQGNTQQIYDLIQKLNTSKCEFC